MATKDFFSDHSKIYAAFRPTYPAELYSFILKHVVQRDAAWDCATGNGQVAAELARHFSTVHATDISQQQINEAVHAPNVHYGIAKAEASGFSDAQFDLITVGQAVHWFDIELFYREVKRTGKSHALIAIWGYSNAEVSPEIDELFLAFYHTTVGKYWDDARRHVEAGYSTIPFPFQPIDCPLFHIELFWTLEHFGGYLTSWSATQKFIRENGFDPVPEFLKTIAPHWRPGEVRAVRFPLFLKLGRIHTPD